MPVFVYYRVEYNQDRATQLYTTILCSFSVFYCADVKMKSKSGIFLVKMSTETPCCSKKNHQKPSLKIKKKFRVGPNFRVGRVTPNQLF